MKNHFFTLTVLLLTCSQTFAAYTNKDAVLILSKTAERLNIIHTLQYHYAREINNYKDNNFSKSAANCYLEFTPDTTMQVARFQFKSDGSLQIFNGREYFMLNQKDHQYEVDDNPSYRMFNSLSYFYNSMASLRSTLTSIIRDSSISKSAHDTILNGKNYEVVTLAMHNKALNYLGSFRNFTIRITLYYDLIIDPVTHLPYQVLEHNNVDGKSYATRTIYTDINTRPTVPLAMSWYYSTYQTNYKLKEQPNVKPLIVAGTLLPDWSLPEYNGEHSGNVQNAMFKNKLVLMDFWIKNCGYCMEAFRHLKDLQQKYSEQLQILAVNAYDPQEDIVFFYNRENPQYKMLYQGKKLAKELGVGSYPKVVLADKEGKVIYAGDFNTFKIEALIRSYK